MIMRVEGLRKTSILVGFLVCGLGAVGAFADSQARIVRLSDLEGDVQVDHGSGYEKAIRNMPVMQGMRIETRNGGLAEVELENGSTVRLAPNTQVAFPELSLAASGGKQTTVELKQGTAYFNLVNHKHDSFEIVAGPEKATLTDSARLRLDRDEDRVKVAVTKGEVRFEGPSGEAKLDKDHTATFDLSQGGQFTLARGVEPQPYDAWNRQESSFQSQYGGSLGHSGMAYGTSDLNYYGGWYNVPGYGTMWQPYSVGLDWDPFMDGSWVWYPGFGYSFVSGYPWGWMPYRYGTWAFVPGWGWGWMPGGFSSWNVVPAVWNAPMGFVPPRRPTGGSGHPTIVARAPAVAQANPGLSTSTRAGIQAGTGSDAAVVRSGSRVPVHGQVLTVNPRTGAVERGFEAGMPHAASGRAVGGIRQVAPSAGMGRAGGFSSAGAAHSSSGSSHSSSSGPPHH